MYLYHVFKVLLSRRTFYELPASQYGDLRIAVVQLFVEFAQVSRLNYDSLTATEIFPRTEPGSHHNEIFCSGKSV